MPKKKTPKVPKTLGACADRLYAIRAEKSVVKKQLDELDAEYKLIKEYLIETLPASDASGVSGNEARASIVVKPKPVAEDWGAFYKYMSRTKSYDLLQKRFSEPAVKARWEDGKKIPGVGVFQAKDVSVTKAK